MIRESRLETIVNFAHALAEMNLDEVEAVARLAALRKARIQIARAERCSGPGVCVGALGDLAALPEEMPDSPGPLRTLRQVELPHGLLIDVVG